MKPDELLRAAQIRTPVYTPEQRAEDHRKLLEAIACEQRLRRRAARFRAYGWLAPTSPELAVLLTPAGTPQEKKARWQITRRLHTELKSLCRTVLGLPGVADRLLDFMGADQPTDTVGARAFGCLLFLRGHDADARFWWRFAGGAEDGSAGYLLFLEALLRGDAREAVHCYRHLGAGTARPEATWDTSDDADDDFDPQLDASLARLQQVDTELTGAVLMPQGYLDEISHDQAVSDLLRVT